jgi:hypothetical protein
MLRAHVPHLVHEQRAVVRDLEQPLALAVRAGEGAALVAEQLALLQRLRDRRAVLGDEGLPAAARVLVDRARDQLLAGARFPLDQDRQLGRRDAVQDRQDLEDARALADDRGVARAVDRRLERGPRSGRRAFAVLEGLLEHAARPRRSRLAVQRDDLAGELAEPLQPPFELFVHRALSAAF